MQKYILILALFLFSQSGNCQRLTIDTSFYKGTYRYYFKPDTTTLDLGYLRQDMVLQIGRFHSKFAAKNKIYADSVFSEINNGDDINTGFSRLFPLLRKKNVEYLCGFNVFKNYPVNRYITTEFTFGHDESFSMKEDKLFNWNLEANTDTLINNFKCKKATVAFGGRSYIAWYSTDIYISEGPYKFNGLPGLIVCIYDKNKEHIFALYNFVKQKVPEAIFTIERNSVSIPSEKLPKVILEKNNQLYITYANNTKNKYPSEEVKIEVLNGILSNNNFIEKY